MRHIYSYHSFLRVCCNLAIGLTLNLNMKVLDASCCVTNVDDASQSAQLLAATTLRNCLGTRNLGEILSEKESIAGEMKEVLDVSTKPWGVTVERVEVMDVKIPNTLQRAMAAEAEAARNARGTQGAFFAFCFFALWHQGNTTKGTKCP